MEEDINTSKIEINEIVQRQKKFFKTNKTKEFGFRIEQLSKIQRLINHHEKEILTALKRDLGKSELESYLSELSQVKVELNLALKKLRKWIKPNKIKNPWFMWFNKSFIKYEPFGVSLIFSPWNYPFNLSLIPLISSIAAGNCNILKVSEKSNHTSRIIYEILDRNFSDDYLKIILGDHRIANHLLTQKTDYIFFTGSSTVGKIVMRNAAENLTPMTLELGGKSPCIVDENIDIEKTAKKIVWGKFLNAGQTCVAPDYLLVHSNVYHDLLKQLKESIKEFYSNNPINSKDYSRIINLEHYQRLINLIQDETVYFGGNGIEEERFIEPTIITESKENSRLLNEEIFGPILPVIKINSINDAIEKINQKPKPLAVYFFSKNKERQKEVIKKTSSGGILLNDVILHLANPNLPFGGVGQSGFGRYHGKTGFETFSNQKSVMFKSGFFEIPKRFPPYDEKMMKFLKKIF